MAASPAVACVVLALAFISLAELVAGAVLTVVELSGAEVPPSLWLQAVSASGSRSIMLIDDRFMPRV